MPLEVVEIVEVSLLRPADNGPRMFPTLAEEVVLLGDEPEPQEAQKATTIPCEHLEETAAPRDIAEQCYAPSPPAPSAIASNANAGQSHATRRAWCSARLRQPAPPDPMDNPKGWISTYMAPGVSYQVGGQSSSPSATGMQGSSVMLRCRS